MKKILVVEDSDFVRENLIDILEVNGYETISAENGFEGYNKAISIIPDLIIADIMMPIMDGAEMLKFLRKNPATSDIPLIFLTAKSTMSDLRDGMNAGADDYLTKPFLAKEVIAAVETRFERKEKVVKKFADTYKAISRNIPHELRTPLVSITGFSNIILEEIDYLEKSEIAEMVAKIKSSSSRIHGTIEKFIQFTESEVISNAARKYEHYKNKRMEIQDIIIDYAIKEKIKVLENPVAVKMDITPGTVNIFEEHFLVILNELLENAIKFSSPNKHIEIKTVEDEDTLSLSIKNYGKSMTDEEIQSTAPFVQHNWQYYEQAGNGLGLVTVRNLTSFYDADFDVTSVQGEYTEVTVKFKKVFGDVLISQN